MNSNILDMVCVDKMYDIMNTDISGVWRIYVKDISETEVILTFCKYINGVPSFQAQAQIFYDDWEENKSKFEKLAYITEV